MRDAFSRLGFGGQDAGSGLCIDFLFWSFCQPPSQLLIANGLRGFQKSQESVDLWRRQGVDDLMKPVQVTHDSLHCNRAICLQYIETVPKAARCRHIGELMQFVQDARYSGTMRTSVSLPDPLLENAKQSAAERGITFSMLVEDALRLLLAKGPSGTLAPFRPHTVRGELVDTGLDLNHTSALAVQEDEANFRQR